MEQKGLSLILLIILIPIFLLILAGVLLFTGVINYSTSGPTLAPLDKVQTPTATSIPTSNPTPTDLPTISSSPSATPATSGSLNLTNADELKTFQVKKGDTIKLTLVPMNGMENWVFDKPDPKILSIISDSDTKTYNDEVVESSAYQVVGSGTTKITASDRPQCDPGQICPNFILGFQVTINSSGDTTH